MEFLVPPDLAGQTLRVFVGDALPLEPENIVRQVIITGNVTVDGETSDPKRVLREGETVVVQNLSAVRHQHGADVVRAPVLYEDEHLLIFNKPAGCTVVRERSAETCPFQNGVLEHLRKSPAAEAINRARYRPRAVHRLDRDTTGAVIVAKSRAGELHLFPQFQERRIVKEYLALVHGEMLKDADTIEAFVASEPGSLDRMSIDERHGKHAVTHYEVLERFRGYTYLRARPHTGRRHQIRIHLAHIGYPIVADRVYGGGNQMLLSSIKRGYRLRDKEQVEKPLIARPALHAAAITFLPVDAAEPVRVEAPLSKDMQVLLKMLRKWAIQGKPLRRYSEE